MKKLTAILLVLALTAPAFAASVALTDNSNGTLTLILTVEAGEVVRGVAVLVSSDTPITSVTGTDAIFNVFPDQAYDDETAAPDSYALSTGSPVADPAAAGVLALPANSISLSMGVLDEGGSQLGASEGTYALGIIDLGGAGTVTLAADTLRGGVVGDNITEVTYQDFIFPPPCVSCYCPCKGDVNGDGFVDGGDVPAFIAAFGSAMGQPYYDPVFDFNCDFYIDGGDVPGFIAAFGSFCHN